jgi:hypothetical protein
MWFTNSDQALRYGSIGHAYSPGGICDSLPSSPRSPVLTAARHRPCPEAGGGLVKGMVMGVERQDGHNLAAAQGDADIDHPGSSHWKTAPGWPKPNTETMSRKLSVTHYQAMSCARMTCLGITNVWLVSDRLKPF